MPEDIYVPSYTPWGAPQTVKTLADGVISYTTSSHGGIFVRSDVNEQIPDYARDAEGWYEEDCGWAIVAYFLPHVLPDEHEEAISTLKHWFPEIYERATGTVLQPGESHSKDEQMFHAAHQDDYIVVTAWGEWHEQVPDGMIAVFATKGGKVKGYNHPSDERWFLIPEEEYKIPCIVDLSKHQEIEALQ